MRIQNPFIKFNRILKSRKKRNRYKKSLSYSKGREFNKKRHFSLKIPFRLNELKTSLALTLIILTLLIIFVRFVHQFLTFTPVRDYMDNTVKKDWDGKEKINILIVGFDQRDQNYGFIDSAAIISIDGEQNSFDVFSINTDCAILLPSKKIVKLKEVYNESLLANNDVPINVVVNSVSSLLSIKIDRYVKLNEEGLEKIINDFGGVRVSNNSSFVDKDLIKNGKDFQLDKGDFKLSGLDALNFVRADDDGVDNKLSRQNQLIKSFLSLLRGYKLYLNFPNIIQSVERNINTDLSKKELLKIFYTLGRIKSEEYGFSSIRAFYKSTEEDGSILYANFDVLDQQIQLVFIERSVIKEQARVEIYNTTKIKGLASFRSRWLKNQGVDVIRVGDNSTVYEKTTIFVNERERYEKTINLIKRTFKEQIEITEEKPEFLTTGDIVIFLGNNAI